MIKGIYFIMISTLLLCGCEGNGLVNTITGKYQSSSIGNHYANTSNDVSYTSYNGNIYTGPVNNNNEDVSYSSANGYITVTPVSNSTGEYYNGPSYNYY